MQRIGDDDRAAPRLVHVRLRHGPAADLSSAGPSTTSAPHRTRRGARRPLALNLLVWADRLDFVDFPQAVDPIAHPDGLRLLERDVFNLCQWGDARCHM